MTFLAGWLAETWLMILEAAPWLVGGFFIAGLIHVLLPTEVVVRHLGRPGMAGVLKAALIGVPLPLCSCSVIPVASSIRLRGASKGATASFLISTPESGVDSISVSYALLGPFMAVVRPIAAFLTATLAGGLIEWHERRGATAAAGAGELKTAPCGCGCSAASPAGEAAGRPSWTARVRDGLRHGLVEMFAALAHWLLLGFALGGLVAAAMPDGFLANTVGTGLVPVFLMLVAGLPLYVCATSATPLAAALIAKGLSPGAALVFLLVGPATNMATMVVVARNLGRMSLFIYVGTIAACAVGLGLLVDAMPFAATAMADAARSVHEHGHVSPYRVFAAVVLLGLMLNGLRVKFAGGLMARLRAARAPAKEAPAPKCH